MASLIVLLSAMAIVAVSLIGMMWGWGLEPKNWGWVAFSYLGLMIPMFIQNIKS